MSSPVITLIGGPTAPIEANAFRLLTDLTFDPPGEYGLSHAGSALTTCSRRFHRTE
jgi:hypothetical protein